MCVCEINEILNMSQPAVSHHLRILKQAGLVKISREGKWTYYSLNPEVFAEVFKEGTDDVLLNYAQPIKQLVDNMKPKLVRTSPEICEKLTRK
jgi:ArsR family transcriptional regulator